MSRATSINLVINFFNFFRHYKSPPLHTVFSYSPHFVILSHFSYFPSHFSSMEQMLVLMLMHKRQQMAGWRDAGAMEEGSVHRLGYYLSGSIRSVLHPSQQYPGGVSHRPSSSSIAARQRRRRQKKYRLESIPTV